MTPPKPARGPLRRDPSPAGQHAGGGGPAAADHAAANGPGAPDRGWPTRGRLRDGRGDRALPRIADPVPHHDHRHVPAGRQPHQQLRAAAAAGRGGQRGTPHVRGTRCDGRDGGLDPLGVAPRRHRDPARQPGQLLADARTVRRGIGLALLTRRIGRGLRRADRCRVVIEMDPPPAPGEGGRVEHDLTGTRGRRDGVLLVGRCHAPEGNQGVRQLCACSPPPVSLCSRSITGDSGRRAQAASGSG